MKDRQTIEYDKAKGKVLSYKEALVLIASHGNTRQEFTQELGKKKEYGKQAVLCWLGY